MDVLAGSNASIRFRFERGAEPIIPTAGSVSYTIRDQNGVPLTGYIDLPVILGPADTSVNIPLPAAINMMTLRVEKRFVVIRWSAQGNDYSSVINYRLVPFLNTTVTHAAVRSQIGGIGKTTLPDDEIDIIRAYLQIEDKLGQPVLEDALSSGGLTEITANDAIRLQAAMDVLPSVKLRVLQKETDGPLSYERADLGPLLDQLEVDIRQNLLAAINTLSGRAEDSFTLLLLTSPTDPITGG